MSFPRYPAYKDSGVEWLGEVPEHWEVLPLKRNARLLTEKTDTRLNPVALENIEGWTGKLIETETEFQGEGVAFQVGDVLFGKLRPYLAKVYLASQPGEAVGDFHVIRPSASLRSRFLQYQLLTNEVIDLVSGSTYGAKMPRASWNFLGAIATAVPPPQEQPLIATFLDRETAKIDALIAEQQRLTELLQEKRQAVISQAVTKGLNPDAPMKDSGVEWLGEVPAHWEVKPLKHLCEIYSGFPFKSDLFQVDGIPVVRMSNISDGAIDLQEAVCVPEHEVPLESLIESGDLLLGLSGSVGNFGIASESALPAAVNQRVARIRTCHPILKHFLSSSIYSDQVTCGLPSTTIANVSASQLGNCLLALPPLKEQEQIEVFLHDFYVSIDELSASTESSIELLQERRSALISSAVTGQIDVRGVVPEAMEQ